MQPLWWEAPRRGPSPCRVITLRRSDPINTRQKVAAKLKGRLLANPQVARANRVRQLVGAEYNHVTGDLRFQDTDRLYRDTLHAPKDFFRRAFQALAYNGIEGDYAEFGCYQARTFTFAWGASRLVGHRAHLWAFDSFEGLPPAADERDVHDTWVEGAMAMSEESFVARCLDHGLQRAEFTTVPGFYTDSLKPDAPGVRPEAICFAYIDCDLYSSTIEALEFVGPRLRNGAVIAFDDYFCFSQTHSSGERLAAADYFGGQDRWNLVPYVQWGWYGMSFMVEDRANGPRHPFP